MDNKPLAGCMAWLLVILAYLSFAFARYVWHPEWRWLYALDYSVEAGQVTIEKKPHDCEYDTSPLGNKNCHYERVISTVRTRPAGGGQMVSNDNWVTSHFVEPWLGPVSPSVTVSWRRVDD
jgi:hypothetical protein